jgi:hypothetical protein
VKEVRNILHTIKGRKEERKKGRKANSIGHILRRNCLLKHVVEGEMEGKI